MSEADYLDDGADYCDIYNGECDYDCENCPIQNECDGYGSF
jgi:hypothetical protein